MNSDTSKPVELEPLQCADKELAPHDLLDQGMELILASAGIPPGLLDPPKTLMLPPPGNTVWEKTVYLGTPKSEENPLEKMWRESANAADNRRERVIGVDPAAPGVDYTVWGVSSLTGTFRKMRNREALAKAILDLLTTPLPGTDLNQPLEPCDEPTVVFKAPET